MWVASGLLTFTLGVAYGVPLGLRWGALAFAIAGAGLAWLLIGAATRIQVGRGGLAAGRALLPPAAIGAATPLDSGAAEALRGPMADARAHLVLRGWVRTAVRVEVADPADPTPYWYVSTRRPEELAVALAEVRAT
jgi:Protein of unknown function (DUF3093)